MVGFGESDQAPISRRCCIDGPDGKLNMLITAYKRPAESPVTRSPPNATYKD